MKAFPFASIDIVIANSDDMNHDVHLQLVQGDTVVQRLVLEPGEADAIARDLTTHAAIAPAKRRGAKGAA